MKKEALGATSKNEKWIRAGRKKLYEAFTDPAAIASWQAPGNMWGRIHNWDLRVGGGYQMSLYYPELQEGQGKTNGREDRFSARFIELRPFEKIVEAIRFESSDESFGGEMIMDISLEEQNQGTLVVIKFSNIPIGIRPEDNEAGTRSSLEKLAAFVEGDPGTIDETKD